MLCIRPNWDGREAIMSDEHLDNLRQARAQLIEQRHAFVRVLAGPYDRVRLNRPARGSWRHRPRSKPWTGPLQTKRGRDAQSMIEAEGTHDFALLAMAVKL